MRDKPIDEEKTKCKKNSRRVLKTENNKGKK